jgi:hypothetical protein
MDNGKMPDVNDTLKERKGQHGEYSENAAMSQALFRQLCKGSSFDDCSDDQKESLKYICMKLTRIVCGDPNHPDHWHDIGGYAKLSEDRIPAKPVGPYGEGKTEGEKTNPSEPIASEVHYDTKVGY